MLQLSVLPISNFKVVSLSILQASVLTSHKNVITQSTLPVDTVFFRTLTDVARQRAIYPPSGAQRKAHVPVVGAIVFEKRVVDQETGSFYFVP